MEENKIKQGEGVYSEPKSFQLYSGEKAPALVQIVAGVMLLGAIGVLLRGVLLLVLSPFHGVIALAVSVLAIFTGKSLFKMKKDAIRNSFIVAILFVGSALWSMVSSKLSNGFPQTEVVEILYAVFLVIIIFKYKDKFVN